MPDVVKTDARISVLNLMTTHEAPTASSLILLLPPQFHWEANAMWTRRSKPTPSPHLAPSQMEVSRSATIETGRRDADHHSRRQRLDWNPPLQISVWQRAEVVVGIKRFQINYSGSLTKCRFPGLLCPEAHRLWNSRSPSVSNNVSSGAERGRALGGQQRPTSVVLLMSLFNPAGPRGLNATAATWNPGTISTSPHPNTASSCI